MRFNEVIEIIDANCISEVDIKGNYRNPSAMTVNISSMKMNGIIDLNKIKNAILTVIDYVDTLNYYTDNYIALTEYSENYSSDNVMSMDTDFFIDKIDKYKRITEVKIRFKHETY